MHLRNGCRGEGNGLEAAEYFVKRPAESLLDHRHGNVAGKRRHPVLQFHQFIADIDGQQIAARREGLAEFHEYRTQLLESQTQSLGTRAADAALKPSPRREIIEVRHRPVHVGRTHELVQPVPHQRPLYLQQTRKDSQAHHNGSFALLPPPVTLLPVTPPPFTRCSSPLSRASIRSTPSRTASTPRRNSSISGRVTRSRPSSCRYSAIFSPAVRLARRAQVLTLFASWDRCRAGKSPTQRDNSSSRSGRAAVNSSRNKLAISASPRICTDDLTCAEAAPPPLSICSSAGADPEMTASAGASSPASNASRPWKHEARTRVMPSTSTCRLVPSKRLASAAAWLDTAMFRLNAASADANQAEVAGIRS